MNSLLDKIRSRGYWRVAIRPREYREDRILQLPSLFPILQKSSVQFRGWDYPHIDSIDKLHRDVNWVGQEIDWQHFLESWRFYQSGQFLHYSGMWQDWRDQSGLWPADEGWKPSTLLGVAGTVFRFTEIFEFAARLALTEAGDELMMIEIKVEGLKNRALSADDSSRMAFVHSYKATTNELPYNLEIQRAELISNARELALEPALKLFWLFGWEPSREHLRSLQPQTRSRS